MATVILVSSGWAAFPGIGSVYAYDRDRWPGPPPKAGQRPPNIDPVAVGSVKPDGYVELTVPENGRFYLGEPFGQRWLSCGSGKADEATEQIRAEAAEQRIEDEIAELREEAPSTARMLIGINSNFAAGHAAYWTSARIFGDRSNDIDVDYSTSPATVSAAVQTSLAAGCKYPLVIVNTSDAVTLGTVNPIVYAAGAVGIIKRVVEDHPTVTRFQIINEPYYKNSSPHGSKISANASTYGAIVKATYEAAKIANLLGTCELMVEAFGEYNVLSAEPGTQTPSTFEHWIDGICTAMRDPYGMVIGDSRPDYPNFDGTTVERAEAFAFTCRRTGAVNEFRFRTSSVANTGITGVKFGIATDSSGKPGTLLGECTFTGNPGKDEWISATLSPTIQLTQGVKYWLIILPLGEPLKVLHYYAAQSGATGTGDLETASGSFHNTISAHIADASWPEVFNQGPIGFMAGSSLTRPLFFDINAWSNHPYGSLGAADGEGNFNWGSTEGFRTKVSSLGAGGNGAWYLTEFGWNDDATQQARMAGFLEKSLAAWQAGWLKGIWAYDDGDGGFTLYNKAAGETLRQFAKLHG